jgi:hypothetical protein
MFKGQAGSRREKRQVAYLNSGGHATNFIDFFVPEVEVSAEDDGNLRRIFVDHVAEAKLELLQAFALRPKRKTLSLMLRNNMVKCAFLVSFSC